MLGIIAIIWVLVALWSVSGKQSKYRRGRVASKVIRKAIRLK